MNLQSGEQNDSPKGVSSFNHSFVENLCHIMIPYPNSYHIHCQGLDGLVVLSLTDQPNDRAFNLARTLWLHL